MPTLNANSSVTVAIAVGDVLRVSGGYGTAQITPPVPQGLPRDLVQLGISGATFGPYPAAVSVALVATSALTYGLDSQAAVSGAGNTAVALASMYDAQQSAEVAYGSAFLAVPPSFPSADVPTITGSATAPASDADAAGKVFALSGSEIGFTNADLNATQTANLARWCGGFNRGLRPRWAAMFFRLSGTIATPNGSTLNGNQDNIQPTPAGGLSPQFGVSNIGYGTYLDFVLDGDVFFFRGQVTFSLWVNDRLVNVAPGAGITGTASNTAYQCSVGAGYTKIKFSSVAVRNIRIGVPLAGGPSDLYVRATHAAWPRFPSRRASILWISDSFAATGATQDQLGSAAWFGTSFGPELDMITGGAGGTGFGAAGSSENILTRIQSMDILMCQQVSAVMVFSGQNDTAAQVTANAPAVFAGLRAKFPNSPIFAGLSYAPGSYASAQDRQNALVAAASGVAGVYIIPTYGATNAGRSWLDGTGRTGALAGNGNADRYVGGADGSDAVHPSNAGHLMWGRSLAREVAALCKSGAVTY